MVFIYIKILGGSIAMVKDMFRFLGIKRAHLSINIIYSIISIIVLTAARQRSKVLIINSEKRSATETAEAEER